DLEWVEESLQIDTQLVTPMPNMPPSVLGLMSSKGHVFWAVNLVELLELPRALPSTQYYEVVVIRAVPAGAHQPIDHQPVDQGWGAPKTENELFLGLVVPKIKGTIRLSPEDITSPSAAVTTSLVPYLRGQVVFDNDTIIILSAAALGAVPSILLPT
ncbi:MAG: chemotaxis protein CheW, partial [Phormidesmis sp.]